MHVVWSLHLPVSVFEFLRSYVPQYLLVLRTRLHAVMAELYWSLGLASGFMQLREITGKRMIITHLRFVTGAQP